MRFRVASLSVLTVLAALPNFHAVAQTMAPTPNQAVSQTAQLKELTRKIDEQNAKIDMLSQEILKLQLEVTGHRPGVIIGEGAPTNSASASTTSSTPATTPAPDSAAKSANGNSHTVARGETLTSIAKMHGVSVAELQKYNHIDNPLKLQAGQTLRSEERRVGKEC